MTSIIYIGMDVHITNYTLCCYTVDADDTFAVVNVKPDYHEILKYMDRVRSTRGGDSTDLGQGAGYQIRLPPASF